MTKNTLFRWINYVLMYAFVRRQKHLMIGRASFLKSHFIEEISNDCPSHEIASFVWSRMQRESALIQYDFKPTAEDLLGKDFGIESEDARDLIVDLAKECGKLNPTWDEIEIDQIKTVRDLAKFIYGLPSQGRS